MNLYLMSTLALLIQFPASEPVATNVHPVPTDVRFFVAAFQCEADIYSPHSETSRRVVFRKTLDAAFGTTVVIGDIEADGMEIEIRPLPQLPISKPGKPSVVEHENGRLVVYPLVNQAALDLARDLKDHKHVDDLEKSLVLIPEHVTNSLIVAGLTRDMQTDFSVLVQELDTPRESWCRYKVKVKQKNDKGEVFESRYTPVAKENQEFSLHVGAVQDFIQLRIRARMIPDPG